VVSFRLNLPFSRSLRAAHFAGDAYPHRLFPFHNFLCACPAYGSPLYFARHAKRKDDFWAQPAVRSGAPGRSTKRRWASHCFCFGVLVNYFDPSRDLLCPGIAPASSFGISAVMFGYLSRLTNWQPTRFAPMPYTEFLWAEVPYRS